MEEAREIQDFLIKYFSGVKDRAEELELRAIQGKKCRTQFLKLADLHTQAGFYFVSHFLTLNGQEWGVYFGTGTRKDGGRKENIFSLPGLWADIDYGKEGGAYETEEQAREYIKTVLDSFPEPSLFINSGHGFHLYWLLNKPYKIEGDNTADIINLFEEIGAGIGDRFYGDRVMDITRIMRIPGTWNTKQKPYIKAVIEKGNWDIKYDIERFTEYRTRRTVKTDSPELRLDTEGGESVEMEEVRKRIGAGYFDMIKQGWEAVGYYKSKSELDSAVIKVLRKAGFSPGQIKRIFLNEPIGGKYRSKGKQGDSYLGLTIVNADRYIEEEKIIKQEKTAMLPHNFRKQYWNTLTGALTRGELTGEEELEVRNWVDSVLDTEEFKQDTRVDCLRYEKDMGTYKQVMLFRKTEELFDGARNIDLELMKKMFLALLNEAIKRRDYVFPVYLPGFLTYYFGKKGLRPDKAFEALMDLNRGEKYTVIKKDGKSYLVDSPGSFIGYRPLGQGAFKVLVNPLYFPDEWDIRTGKGIGGYTRIPLPFGKNPRKKLDRYENGTRDFLRAMKVAHPGVYQLGIETLLRRIGVKEYDLKRKQNIRNIWDRIKKVFDEEALEYKIIPMRKEQDIKYWTLQVRRKGAGQKQGDMD